MQNLKTSILKIFVEKYNGQCLNNTNKKIIFPLQFLHLYSAVLF